MSRTGYSIDPITGQRLEVVNESSRTWIMSPRAFVAAIGALLALAGIVGLSVPVTSALPESSVTCGTGWSMNSDDLTGLGNWLCQSATDTRRAWSWPLVGVGVVTLGGAAMVRRRDAA